MTNNTDDPKKSGDVDGDDEEGKKNDESGKKDPNSDPVDAISGKVFYNLADFFYPGPIPLRWERSWSSGNIDNIGLFGYGSSSAYSMHIVAESDKIIFVNGDGDRTPFDTLVPGEKAFKRSKKMTLSYDGEKYEIFHIDTR